MSVSSSGHLRSPVIFDDLHFGFRPYEPFLAYGQSKTANVLFSVEPSRSAGRGTGSRRTRSCRAGSRANLQRHVGGADYIEQRRRELQEQASTEIRFKTVEQGAATSVLLAASPLLEGA